MNEKEREKRKQKKMIRRRKREAKRWHLKKAVLYALALPAWIIQIIFAIPGFIFFYFGVLRKKIGVACALLIILVQPFKDGLITSPMELIALYGDGYLSSSSFWEAAGTGMFVFIVTSIAGWRIGCLGAFVLNHTAFGFIVDDAIKQAGAREILAREELHEIEKEA